MDRSQDSQPLPPTPARIIRVLCSSDPQDVDELRDLLLERGGEGQAGGPGARAQLQHEQGPGELASPIVSDHMHGLIAIPT